MKIEVVYATPEYQSVVFVDLPDRSQAVHALLASALLNLHPEISIRTPLGVYGQQVDAETELADGDRVEIYRPLILAPMQARRARAKRQQGAESGAP